MSKGNVFLGTSGYSYQHWRDVFYPKDLKEIKWLEYYAEYFDTVELNVTFYRLPQESAFLSWYKRTPKDFKFAVKGSRFITHIKKLKSCRQPLKLFFSRVKLLKEKLGPILWQLPPSFKADSKRLEEFFKSLRKYRDTRYVFEFRNQTWYSREIFDILKSEKVALCSADWPTFSKDVHSVHVTADFLYVRRHGQGARLYNGCYSNRQLEEDAKVIRKNLRQKKDVYIYFNNDAYGYAVENALTLKKMMKAYE